MHQDHIVYVTNFYGTQVLYLMSVSKRPDILPQSLPAKITIHM